MILLLFPLAALLFVLPSLLAASERGRAPAQLAGSSLLSLLAGVGALELGLVLIAAPTLWHLAEPHGWAARCHRVLLDLAPGGPILGWLAFAGALALLGRLSTLAVATRRRNRRARVEATLGHHVRRVDYELVTLPTTELVAYGVDHPAQVVISEGLVARLHPDALAAVVRHEAAHLRLGHGHYLVVATVVERTLGWLAPVQRSVAVLRSALEQWADDVALVDGSGADGLRGALLDVGGADRAGAASVNRPGVSVLDRAVRLADPRRHAALRGRWLLHLPGLMLVVAGLAVSFRWLLDAGPVLVATNYCPG